MGYMPPPPKPIVVPENEAFLLRRALKKTQTKYTVKHEKGEAHFTIAIDGKDEREKITELVVKYYEAEKELVIALEKSGIRKEKISLKDTYFCLYQTLIVLFILGTPYWLSRIASEFQSTIPIWFYAAIHCYSLYDAFKEKSVLEKYFNKVKLYPPHIMLSAGMVFVTIVLQLFVALLPLFVSFTLITLK